MALLAGVGALCTLWFEYSAAVGWGFLATRAGWWMTVWALLPYIIIFCGRRMANGLHAKRVVFWISLLVVMLGLYSYYQAFFMHLDAQSALVFLFTPLLQSLVCAILLLMIKILRK